MPLTRCLAALAFVVSVAACGPSKPTQKQCAAACTKSFELHFQDILKRARGAAGADRKKAEENVEKAKTEWESIKTSGREAKRIEDCTLTCMADGTSDQVECMAEAESVKAVKACKDP